jgi:hydroxymethylpyrimidine pyrophosphatase-like HAD family hydrolase
VRLPRYRPQLIALDMDGTLCDDANRIPPANTAALARCRSRGIHIAVLTGRRRTTLAAKLDELYAACEAGCAAAARQCWFTATNSGGLVWEYPGWRQQSAVVMPPAMAAAIVERLAPHSLNVHVNPATSQGTELIHLRRTGSLVLDGYYRRFGQDALDLSDAAGLAAFEVTLLAIPGEPELIRQLGGQLRALFSPEELSILMMRWPLLDAWALEIYTPQLSKATALAGIARRLGVSRQHVAAAGDDLNDCSMLGWAGHSAAMPHAPVDVIEAAQLQLDGQGAAALAPWLEALAALPAAAAP